jgi:hypothetical protein
MSIYIYYILKPARGVQIERSLLGAGNFKPLCGRLEVRGDLRKCADRDGHYRNRVLCTPIPPASADGSNGRACHLSKTGVGRAPWVGGCCWSVGHTAARRPVLMSSTIARSRFERPRDVTHV